MKPLVLALAVALFATLLNLVVSAGTDGEIKVVASYEGYDKRQFTKRPNLACVTADGWENVDSASAMLENLASGNNDQGQILYLSPPTIMFKKDSSNDIMYCNYVFIEYDGPTITTMEGKRKPLLTYKAEPYAFYAKKVADSKPNTIMETAAEVLAMLTVEKKMIHRTIMVEITDDGEDVYVGPMAYGRSPFIIKPF